MNIILVAVFEAVSLGAAGREIAHEKVFYGFHFAWYAVFDNVVICDGLSGCSRYIAAN